MMLRRVLLTVVVLAACGACTDVPTQFLRDSLAPKDCPGDIGMGPMLNGKFLRDSTKSKYLTFIIDGKIARWNYNETKGGPINIPGYPAMDEIKNIHMLSNSMSFTEISRKYNTCFGVNVQLVETKAGNWEPIASPYAAVPQRTRVSAKQ